MYGVVGHAAMISRERTSLASVSWSCVVHLGEYFAASTDWWNWRDAASSE
jgi:hypothetical protein